MDAGAATRAADEALAGPQAAAITGSTVYAFAQSPFTVWCERHAPASEKDELGAFQRMLFEQGNAHEARAVATRYPGAQTLQYATEEEGFRLALDAMARGVRVLHGAPLLWRPEGLAGRADVLERREGGPSRWGDWHYVVKEVKLARNVQDHHRLQGAFYNHVLGRVQGFTPAAFHVINRDLEEATFPYDEAELLATLRAIRAIQQGERPPPVYGSGLWPWESYTNRCAKEERDLSLVSGVGASMRQKLVAAGLATVDALAAAPPERLTAIKGIADRSATKLRRNAEAVATGRHIRVGPVRFDAPPAEVFLDLEGTSAQATADGLVEVDYLIGALVRRGSAEEYVPFVARTLDAEGEAFHAFVRWLAELGPCVIYHWTSYEPTHLRRLAERHGDAGHDLPTLLFGRMRDLHKDATAAFAWPTPSTSIKALAPYAGFSWRHKGVDGMASIALYFAYLADPAANADRLDTVIEYNHDDCIAMRVVKDWLVAEAT